MATPITEEFNLLIIDPQRDFVDDNYPDEFDVTVVDPKTQESKTTHVSGRLSVVGAKKDIGRISQLINTHKDKIKKIFVSLDTHTVFHIGHRFWRELKSDSSDGEIAPPGTTFKLEGEKIIGSDGKQYVVNVDPSDRLTMNKYAVKYLNKVITEGANDGRNSPCTWPVHCIQGTPGWNIHSDLASVLSSSDVKPKVEYHIKGQNQLAEMYSIMKAEAPYEDIVEDGFDDSEKELILKYVYNPTTKDDIELKGFIAKSETPIIVETKTYTPTAGNDLSVIKIGDNTKYNLQTTFNKDLFNSLTEGGSTILVCGEALSHCVQFSTRDIVNEIASKSLPNKVYLVQNASSYVNLDAIGLKNLTALFKDSANKFIEDLKCSRIENSTTGTLEINMVSGGFPLNIVPCVQSTTKSSTMATVRRNAANLVRGGRKTKQTKKNIKNVRKNRKSRKPRK
jgi:nicotinamidase-related amidase